jgi:hypothetical protein
MLLAGTVTNNNIDLKKENSIGDQEYVLTQKVQNLYFCYVVNPYGFSVRLSLVSFLCYTRFNVKWTCNFKAFYAGFPEAPGVDLS